MIEPNWKLIKQLKKERKDNQNKPHLIMKILKTIKEYQVSILIAFIIVSILYAIHMFRYEYIPSYNSNNKIIKVYRVDRITNESCLYMFHGLARERLMYAENEWQDMVTCDE